MNAAQALPVGVARAAQVREDLQEVGQALGAGGPELGPETESH